MKETPGKNKKDEAKLKKREQYKKSLELARKYKKETPKEEIEKEIEKAGETSSEYPPPFNLTKDEFFRSLGLDPENLDDDKAWEEYKKRLKAEGIDIED